MNQTTNLLRSALIGLVICFAFISVGCNDASKMEQRLDPGKYTCTDEQLDLVAKETEICDNTGYLSSYCFAVAKCTHCTKIVDVPIGNDLITCKKCMNFAGRE